MPSGSRVAIGQALAPVAKAAMRMRAPREAQSPHSPDPIAHEAMRRATASVRAGTNVRVARIVRKDRALPEAQAPVRKAADRHRPAKAGREARGAAHRAVHRKNQPGVVRVPQVVQASRQVLVAVSGRSRVLVAVLRVAGPQAPIKHEMASPETASRAG